MLRAQAAHCEKKKNSEDAIFKMLAASFIRFCSNFMTLVAMAEYWARVLKNT